MHVFIANACFGTCLRNFVETLQEIAANLPREGKKPHPLLRANGSRKSPIPDARERGRGALARRRFRRVSPRGRRFGRLQRREELLCVHHLERGSLPEAA